MACWLAETREGQDSDWIQRFDPRFWTVNFPRPMMAALTTTAPDALRVDAVFLREGDLAGIIWDSVDRFDHPLTAYPTDRDYSRTTLSFRWRSAGVIALDAVNGPTLTIEGRDAAGLPRSWYVRLWNYAAGSAADAQITLDFSALVGGYVLPGESDPVHPGQIDRMFISLVAPGYVAASTAPLAAPAEGWAELTQIRCEGRGALLEIGDVMVPPHGLAVATAYDDCCNQAPARLIRNVLQLGYRGSLLHYVGMSHFMRLVASGGGFLVPGSGEPLCTPAKAWHRDFFAAAKAAGFSPIASLSYELLAQHCPDAWQQRASDGTAARTAWDPPSALLSPRKQCSDDVAARSRCRFRRTNETSRSGSPLPDRRAVVVGDGRWPSVPLRRCCQGSARRQSHSYRRSQGEPDRRAAQPARYRRGLAREFDHLLAR